MSHDEPATAGGGYPQGPPQPGDPAGPAPRPRPRRWRRGLAVLLVVGLCAAAVVWGLRQYADRQPAPGGTNRAESASNRQSRSGPAPDPRRAAVTAALDRQSRELLGGRRAGFLAVADPAADRARSWLTGRFTSLRAMGVARWSPTLVDFAAADTRGTRWAGTVRVRYCLADPGCEPTVVELDTVWTFTAARRPTLVDIRMPAQARAAPWERDRLLAVSGARTVVATTAGNADLLSSTSAVAEAAARVADRFALAGRPGRYVVYLAGEKEWKRWSPTGMQGWVAGYAWERNSSVVVRVAALASTDLSELLRHEFAHVATLRGRDGARTVADNWWLVEGLAEYAAMHGRPASAYPNAGLTARFARRALRDDLAVTEPPGGSSRTEVAGRYGLAYLAVGCLAQQYGRAAMLRFFQAVAVRGQPLATAAPELLKAPWPAVSRRCVSQIRRATG